MNVEDRLEAALSGDMAAIAASTQVSALVDTGDEVGGMLAAWTLDPRKRAQLYAAALAIADASGLRIRVRSIGLDRRVQALAGGVVVTLAAAAGLAIARGRHRGPAPLSA